LPTNRFSVTAAVDVLRPRGWRRGDARRRPLRGDARAGLGRGRGHWFDEGLIRRWGRAHGPGGVELAADAADADCAATCLLTPWAVKRSVFPVTSWLMCSTAVNVTAVITTHESSQPMAMVNGLRANRRLPSPGSPKRRAPGVRGVLPRGSCASLPRGGRDGEPGPSSSGTPSLSAPARRPGVKAISKPSG
jgi:hypothetical protein